MGSIEPFKKYHNFNFNLKEKENEMPIKVKKLEKNELAYFYQYRKLFYEANSLPINLYILDEYYVYQDLIDEIIELITDDIDFVIKKALYKLKNYKFENKYTPIIKYRKEELIKDIEKLIRLKETKEIIPYNDFKRPTNITALLKQRSK